MSFKLLILSSIYEGSLESFKQKNLNISKLTYDEHFKLLFDNSTEFFSSYTKGFNKLGLNASCIIANDDILQQKWCTENGIRTLVGTKILFEQVKKNKPEVLFVDDLRFIDTDWLNLVRKEISSIKLIVAYHCAPYNNKIIETLKGVDFIFTCTPGLKNDFEKFGYKAHLVYHGFNNELLPKVHMGNNLPEKELIFAGSLFPGNGYHQDRIDLIESILKENVDISLYLNLESPYKIKAKQTIHIVNSFLKKIKLNRLNTYFKFLEYGERPVKNYSKSLLKKRQQPRFGTDMYNLLSNSKIILNSHVEAAGNYAGNMRLFEATGLGTCLLTDNKINIAELFEPNKEIVVYDNAKDCVNKLKWLLENEEERKRIALAGQQRTLKSHTVENRCKQIVEIIKLNLK